MIRRRYRRLSVTERQTPTSLDPLFVPFRDLRVGDRLLDLSTPATVVAATRPIAELADREEGVGYIDVVFDDMAGRGDPPTWITDFLDAARLIARRGESGVPRSHR